MKRAPEKLLKALLEAERLQAANKRNKALQAGRQAYRLALDYLPVGHPERRRAARVLGLVLKALSQHAGIYFRASRTRGVSEDAYEAGSNLDLGYSKPRLALPAGRP